MTNATWVVILTLAALVACSLTADAQCVSLNQVTATAWDSTALPSQWSPNQKLSELGPVNPTTNFLPSNGFSFKVPTRYYQLIINIEFSAKTLVDTLLLSAYADSLPSVQWGPSSVQVIDVENGGILARTSLLPDSSALQTVSLGAGVCTTRLALMFGATPSGVEPILTRLAFGQTACAALNTVTATAWDSTGLPSRDFPNKKLSDYGPINPTKNFFANDIFYFDTLHSELTIQVQFSARTYIDTLLLSSYNDLPWFNGAPRSVQVVDLDNGGIVVESGLPKSSELQTISLGAGVCTTRLALMFGWTRDIENTPRLTRLAFGQSDGDRCLTSDYTRSPDTALDCYDLAVWTDCQTLNDCFAKCANNTECWGVQWYKNVCTLKNLGVYMQHGYDLPDSTLFVCEHTHPVPVQPQTVPRVGLNSGLMSGSDSVSRLPGAGAAAAGAGSCKCQGGYTGDFCQYRPTEPFAACTNFTRFDYADLPGYDLVSTTDWWYTASYANCQMWCMIHSGCWVFEWVKYKQCLAKTRAGALVAPISTMDNATDTVLGTCTTLVNMPLFSPQ